MKCVVLGGGGFIGSHLVDALLDEGHEVVVMDRPNLKRFRPFAPHERAVWVEGDALNAHEWEAHAQGTDVVFHLVSTTLPQSSNGDPAYDVQSNLLRTLEMLDMLVKAGCRRVVFVSSGGTVYGVPSRMPIAEDHPTDPLCSYGIVKLAIEKYLELYRQLHGLEYRVLRVSNPYGERQRLGGGQGAATIFLDKASRRENIEIWGNGSVVRDYLHVSDVARAMVLAAAHDGAHRVFNIGSGQGVSLNELMDTIEGLLRRPVARTYAEGRRFDVPVSVLDVSRAAAELEWVPRISLAEGLQRTLRWLSQSDGRE